MRWTNIMLDFHKLLSYRKESEFELNWEYIFRLFYFTKSELSEFWMFYSQYTVTNRKFLFTKTYDALEHTHLVKKKIHACRISIWFTYKPQVREEMQRWICRAIPMCTLTRVESEKKLFYASSLDVNENNLSAFCDCVQNHYVRSWISSEDRVCN